MNCDILAIGAHPDDIELACSGTLIKEINNGKKVVLLDLTLGELGSRGNSSIRTREATKSAQIMGAAERVQLNLSDGFFEINETSLIEVIKQIRHFKPTTILANATSDRHPDHGRASDLVRRAAFLSGLVRIETEHNGSKQFAHRSDSVFFYLQDRNIGPDFVVDITDTFETKIECIKAFDSQFYKPNSTEPETPISTKSFWDFIEARARDYGRSIGKTFGEGFICEKGLVGVDRVNDLF